jgi:epsin
LREATSNQNWGCPNSVLYEITTAAQDFHDRRKIMKAFEEKLSSEPHRWKRILKTLTLLEFMLKNCSEDILPEMVSEQTRVRRLQNFHYSEEGKEKGQIVRDKANAIIDLVSNQTVLRAAREEARDHKTKMVDGNRSACSSGTASSSQRATHGHSRASMERRFDEMKKKRAEGESQGQQIRSDRNEQLRSERLRQDRERRDRDSPRDDSPVRLPPPGDHQERPRQDMIGWSSSSDDEKPKPKAERSQAQAADLLDFGAGGDDSGSAPSGGYMAFAPPAPALGGDLLTAPDPVSFDFGESAVAMPSSASADFADFSNSGSAAAAPAANFANFGSSALAPPPPAPAGFGTIGNAPSKEPNLLDLM